MQFWMIEGQNSLPLKTTETVTPKICPNAFTAGLPSHLLMVLLLGADTKPVTGRIKAAVSVILSETAADGATSLRIYFFGIPGLSSLTPAVSIPAVHRIQADTLGCPWSS